MKYLLIIYFIAITGIGYSFGQKGSKGQSYSNSQSNKVLCSEKEKKHKGDFDPVITKKCLFGNYKSVTTSNPDYKGRYFQHYELYKKIDNHFVKINNAQLFNDPNGQLILLINQQIKKDYTDLLNDTTNRNCFENTKAPTFTIDELGIEFDDNHINFNVTFGLVGACHAVDGTTVSFSMDEIKQYLYK